MPNVGFRHTEKSKNKIRESVKIALSDPVTLKKLTDAINLRYSDPSAHEKLSIARKKYLSEHPEVMEKLIDMHRGKPAWNRGTSPPNDAIEKIRLHSKKRYDENPDEFYDRMCKPHIGNVGPNKGKKWDEPRCKERSLSQLNKHNPNWKNGASFGKWCPKFNPVFKRNVRNFFGNICVLCEKTTEQNKAELSVHHVFTEKMACCEDKISEMIEVRRRLPVEIAEWDKEDFTQNELKYIRMMVPLCKNCHGMQNCSSENVAYENTTYRKYFTNFILNKYGGKCYND